MIPINVDVNAARHDYAAALATGRVLLHSAFYTIQGEGPFAGVPAVFLRLAGCNIGLKQDCPWCDTAFALADGKETCAADVLNIVESYADVCKLAVITGGEPLLQWQGMLTIIERINEQLPRQCWQFETNGLLLREDMLPQLFDRNITMVVSPKIPHTAKGYRPLPRWLVESWPAQVALKYVVSADEGDPYHLPPPDALEAKRKGFDVYVSGMTVYKRAPQPGEVANVWDDTLVDRQATARNYAHAARLAMDSGFTVSYQSHLFGSVQ